MITLPERKTSEELLRNPFSYTKFNVFADNCTNLLSFNVMPNRQVNETLNCSRYEFSGNYGEAFFCRSYQTEMERSPDHLSAPMFQIHTQKMVYAYLCHYFDLKYAPLEKEKIKLWATKLEMKLNRLVRTSENLIQKLWVSSLKTLDDGSYCIELCTTVDDDAIIMNATANIYFL